MKLKPLTPKQAEAPQEQEAKPLEKIEVSDTLHRIDKALEQEEKKRPVQYWTCYNRFNGTGNPGECLCTRKFLPTRATTSRAGLELPIRCDKKGVLLK